MPKYQITFEVATHDTDGYEKITGITVANNEAAAQREAHRRALEMERSIISAGGACQTRNIHVEPLKEG